MDKALARTFLFLFGGIALAINSAPTEAKVDERIPCECPAGREWSIQDENLKFLNGHKQRLESDLKRIEMNLNPKGKEIKGLRDWQKVALRDLRAEKKDALKRVLSYKARFETLPRVHLIIDDLYSDFTPKDCGVLKPPTLDHLDSELGLNRYMSKRLYLGNTDTPMPNLMEALKKILTEKKSPESEFIKKTLEIRCQKPLDSAKKNKELEAGVCANCKMSKDNVDTDLRNVIDQVSGCGGSVKCVSGKNEFLRALEVSPSSENEKSTERDLSNFYSKPESQGQTDACAGFAVGADLEAELYKMSLGGFVIPTPNPWGIYSTLKGQSPAGNCGARKSGVDYRGGIEMELGLNTLSRSNLCLPGLKKSLRVSNSVALTETKNIDIDFFKTLIDADKPVVVGLKTDQIMVTEDWSEPVEKVSSEQGIAHVAVVVGYGFGINPMSLKEEPYVVVRDSLYNQPRHLKIGIRALQNNLYGVWKTKNLEIVD